MVLAPDIQGVHGDVAVTGRPHTDSGRGAAANNTQDRESQKEERVGLAHGTAGIGHIDLSYVVVDGLGGLRDLRGSIICHCFKPGHCLRLCYGL